AKEGATVVAFKGLPKDVPGVNNLEERQNKFRQLLTQIDSSATTTQGVSETSLGQGKFLVGDDLEELLTETTARKETLTEHGLQFIRKQNENGPVYFIANWNDSRH